MVVGALQSFQFFRQNTLLLKNSEALSEIADKEALKFFCEILHCLEYYQIILKNKESY